MDLLQATVLNNMMSADGWGEYSDIVTMDIMRADGRAIYTHLQNLHGTGGTDISPAALQLSIRAQHKDDRADELCELVDEIAGAPEVSKNELRKAVVRFAQRQLLEEAAIYIGSNLHADTLDPHVPRHLVERAVEVGARTNAEVVDLMDSDPKDWTDDRPAICGFGISNNLDNGLGGGVAAGELTLIVAPPKRGKTSYLCAVGANAASQGKKVLHITLELSGRRVRRRYDQCLTGLTRAEMIEQPQTVRAGRRKITEAGGFVKVQDWSYTKPTPTDIEGLVRRMRSAGDRVDFIIVDYLKHVRPTVMPGARYDMRHWYGEMYEQMRAMAVRLDCAVVGAWQINRAGADVDEIRPEHLSETWDAAQVCDIILSLNQSEAEQREHVMRVHTMYQRDNTSRPCVELRSNLDRMIIRDLKDVKVRDNAALPSSLITEEQGDADTVNRPGTGRTNDASADASSP